MYECNISLKTQNSQASKVAARHILIHFSQVVRKKGKKRALKKELDLM